MVSESWDGKRVYFTSSLLANWDKTTSTAAICNSSSCMRGTARR
jgi:hypothetical protein